jgi:hypothetical protein
MNRENIRSWEMLAMIYFTVSSRNLPGETEAIITKGVG